MISPDDFSSFRRRFRMSERAAGVHLSVFPFDSREQVFYRCIGLGHELSQSEGRFA